MDEFNPNGGGAERWTARFASHLLEAGHEVHVIGFRVREQPPGIVVHLLDDPRSVLGRAKAVEARIACLPPMVLHDSGTSWCGHVFHPQTGSRLLSMEREISSHVAWRRMRARISPRTNWRRFCMARIERRAAANASRVIAVSRRVRAILASRHRIPADRFALICNGISTSRFSSERLLSMRAAARASINAGDGLICLMVAHNLRLKGLDTALRALALLRGQGADVRLVVAGGTPDRPWSGLTSRMGLADHVLFAGDVRDIERLYAAADVMVHPTRWDACSLATIEGMAAGLPVVTTAANGASDLITNHQDGFVMPDPTDHVLLASHVAALRDGGLRRRIGEAARARAAFADIDENCRAVEAVLAAVASDVRNPAGRPAAGGPGVGRGRWRGRPDRWFQA